MEKRREDKGDFDEWSDEEDKKSFGIFQCLPVDDEEPDWEVGEDALTVDEYLRRVRYEARNLPQTVVSERVHAPDDAGSSACSSDRGGVGVADTCPTSFQLPTAAWIRAFLRNFASLRRRLRREEELIPVVQHSYQTFYERTALEEATLAAERHALISNPPSSLMPELQEYRGMEQTAIANLIQQQVMGLMESGRVIIDKTRSAKLYALSAKLELPLHSDMAATYRSLVHMCYRWMKCVQEGKGEETDPASAYINILLVVAGAFFQQDENLAGYMGELEDKEEGAL